MKNGHGPISETEMHQRLELMIENAGGVRLLARRLGVSAAYVSDVRHGKRGPGPKILGPMKLRRVRVVHVSYEERPR